jgi:hypothetical protein
MALAGEETYTAAVKETIIQLYDEGCRTIAAQLRLGVREDSVYRSVRRWKNNLITRGHLKNIVRGGEAGTKFVLDETELNLIKQAQELFPDMMAHEVILWLRANGCR